MNVQLENRGLRRQRRWVAAAIAVGTMCAGVAVFAAAEPDTMLRLRVIGALTAHEVWAVGTDVQVSGSEVRVQGFVRSEADRAHVLAVAGGVSGVERVRDRLSLTAWPEPVLAEAPAQVALLAGNAD